MAISRILFAFYGIKGKYSASIPSSFDPACSHMNKYSSQAGSNGPGALSKHLQFSGPGCFEPDPNIYN